MLVVELLTAFALWLVTAACLAGVIGRAAALGDRQLRSAARPRRIADFAWRHRANPLPAPAARR